MGQNDTMKYTPSALAARLPNGTPDHIRRLFAAVPRHRFLSDVMWGPGFTRYDRTSDPEAWTRAVYTDQALTTQLDDGHEGGRLMPSSSSSAPTVMARMLAAADLAPTHRVLEVGTGTGYNAALLCQMLGSSQVTTVEIDASVAETARSALFTHGAHPTVLTGDGEEAAGDLLGYDRVIATCSVSRVPAVWLRRMRGRGRIVAPWAPSPGAPNGALAVLDTTATTAEGRFEGGLAFMWARGQRDPGGTPPPHQGVEAQSTERVQGDPRVPWLDGEEALLLSLLMPHWAFGMGMEEGGTDPYVWVTSTSADPGWARLHADGRVEQGGGRRLVDEAAGAWDVWQRWDRPAVADFGLTVDLEKGLQTVWVHGPQHALWSTPR